MRRGPPGLSSLRVHGRTCDGYGIWGGGGRSCSSQSQLFKSHKDRHHAIPQSPASAFTLAVGSDQGESFDWFKCQTVIKLPASYSSSFWDTLILQAGLTEPAVMHAVLALSSLHKREALQRGNAHTADDQQQLRHYVRAMSHLQPHASTQDGASYRVALIACFLFVCLEFLRGHFQTGLVHLRNGLSILRELQPPLTAKQLSPPCRNGGKSVDDCITDAFSRLQLQVELLHSSFQFHATIEAPAYEPFHGTFGSHNHAWKQLQQLIHRAIHISNRVRQQKITLARHNTSSPQLPTQYNHRQLQTELSRWINQYDMFRKSLPKDARARQKQFHLLLHPYHTMATIMAATCTRPGDESAYDLYTDEFLLLIRQLLLLRGPDNKASTSKTVPSQLGNMSRSFIDLGWIPPLYFTATKCRVHRIRLQAIKLLQSTDHREGIWDAKATGCVARKIMEIEEADFYREFEAGDDFHHASPILPGEPCLPVLPVSNRIQDAEMELLGSPMDHILLFGQEDYGDQKCRVLLSTYSIPLQCWIDS